MMATAITGGEVEITGLRMDHLTAVISKLHEVGVRMEPTAQGVRISTPGPIRGVDCTALPYPGFPTDLQAQWMALLSVIPGTSVVLDKIFPDRFMHVPELVRLGAQIRREGPSAIITGVSPLSGACVMASDLRASAALVLAALAAEGETVIRRIYHLDRGYDRLDDKLNRLGAEIRRLPDEPGSLPASLQVQSVAGSTPPGHELTGPNWLKRPASVPSDEVTSA